VSPLPFHRFEIISQLKRQDALQALRARLEPVRMFRARWPNRANDKRFEGKISDDGFEVRRVLGYNNPFAPRATGLVNGAGVGSVIQVTMKPSIIVVGFATLWLALGLIGIGFGGGEFWMGALLVAMLYVGLMLGFWMEAPRQERVLREIFKAL